MSTSVIEREPGGAKRRSTLKVTARKVAMVGVGVSMLGSGMLLASSTAFADQEDKITICHWDQGGKFGSQTIAKSAVMSGHAYLKKNDIWQGDKEDIIPSFNGLEDGQNLNHPDAQFMLANDCKTPAEKNRESDASILVTVCIVNLTGGSPYTAQQFRRDAVVNLDGTAKNPGPATTVAGVYPASPYGNIVPAIKKGQYPTNDFDGVNNSSETAGAILGANCNWNRISPSPTPTPTVTVTTPGTNTTTTNTVTVPGPTVTVTATPTPTASAVPPVAIAPVVTPSATPSRVPPVAVAPVTAAVPTAVNAGDGSSQNRPMSPVSIVLLALAGVGVLYAALRLSTRRRTGSSQ